MPPRSIIAVIVVFWLAMTVWLIQRDVWPRLAPGEPPPFAVHYADDLQATSPPGRWRATQIPVGRPDQATHHSITTRVVYRPKAQPIDYLLEATMVPRLLTGDALQLYTVRKMTSAYRVDEDGRLLGFSAEVETAAGPLIPLGDLHSRFTGERKDGVCELSWERKGSGGPTSGTEHFEVSLLGNVLLPLHPVARITGLTPGKRWGAQLIDPLESLSSAPKVTWVQATVRRQTETLVWNHKEKTCRVVDYEGDGGDVRGSTWVDTSEDKVLRMEVRLRDQQWEIVRE